MSAEHLPAVVAIPWRRFADESNPRLKLWAACEVYEVLVRFGVMLQLAELRGLPDGDTRLAAAVARIRPDIELPTLGKWLGMLAELSRQLRLTDPLVLPGLPALTAVLAALSPPDAPRTFDASLLALRNALAHGGGITAPLAERLLAGSDTHPGWDARLRGAVDALACLAGSAVVWFQAGHARPITPDGGLAEALPLSADLRVTLTAAGLDRRVLLLKGDRALNLWPLCDYAPATMTGWGRPLTTPGPVPQVYFRAETNRLLYAALGSDVPVHTSDGHAAFRQFFGLTRPREPHQPPANDFAADIRGEADATTGREVQLAELKAVVKAATDRVLWVSGPGGIGKSYLVATLAHHLSNGTRYATVFWRFRAGDADRCHRHAFFRHAIRTLGDPQLGLVATQAFPSPDPSQLLKQFLDLLKEAGASTARRPLFVLDGVDEIARSDPEFVRSVPDWRAGSAVWVCAGRHEGEVVPGVFAADRCQHVWPGGLPGLSEGEVRQMIDARIGPAHFARLLANDTDRDGGTYNQLTDAITRRAAGLPLYVHFVCEDVLTGHLPLDGTLHAKLPDSLAKYYDDLLRRRGVGDVDALKTPLVVLVAWALAPLDADTLRELLQRRRSLPRDRAKADHLLARGLEAVQSMLRAVSLEGGRVGYEPYHLTFRDHIRADDGVSGESDTARDLYCECAADWSRFAAETPARQYLLRHGSEHLLREKRWDELAAVARDVAFLTAQQVELPTDPGSVIRTLQHALTAAGEQDSGIGMAEAVLRLADRHEQLRQASPLDLLRAGNLEGAMNLADLQDPQRRVLHLLLLAFHSHHVGNSEAVVASLARLRQSSATVLEEWQAELAWDLLLPLIEGLSTTLLAPLVTFLTDGMALKLLDKLLDLRSRNPPPPGVSQPTWETLYDIPPQLRSEHSRGKGWCAIALARAADGDAAGAIAAVGRMDGVWGRASALVGVTRVQAERGDLDAARATASLLEKGSDRSNALAWVARAEGKRGDLAAALVTVEQAGPAHPIDRALEQIAEDRVRGWSAPADLHQLFQIADAAKSDFERNKICLTLVRGLAAAGDHLGALAVVERISNEYDLCNALQAVAVARGERGELEVADAHFRRAAGVASSFPVKETREAALYDISAWQAKLVDASGEPTAYRAAVAEAERREAGWKRMYALGQVAVAQASNGDRAGAEDTFGRAVATALTIRDEERRSEAFGRLVEFRLAAGDVAGAVTDAARVLDRERGTETWCRVAVAQSEAGDADGATASFRQAVSAAARWGVVWRQEEAVGKVVAAMLAVGRTDLARTTAAGLTQAEHRGEGLRAVGTCQLAQKDIRGAADTFLEGISTGLPPQGVRANDDIRRAAAWAESWAGNTAHVVHHTDAIADELTRDNTLMNIASAMADAGNTRAALTLAERIGLRLKRAVVLEAVAAARAAAGDVAGLAETAATALAPGPDGDHEWGRSELLAAVAVSQAVAGDVAGAMSTLASVAEPHDAAKVLGAVAVARLKSGDRERAVATLREGLAVADRIKLAWRHAGALVVLAPAQARIENAAAAVATVDQIERREKERAEALAEVAVVQFDRGESSSGAATFQAAVAAAAKVHDVSERATALAAIGGAMTRAGQTRQAEIVFSDAEGLTLVLTEELKRSRLLSEIARVQVRCGETARAIRLAERIAVSPARDLTPITLALIASNAVAAFKHLLPFTARDVETATHACGQLARLYPADAAAIAELLLSRRPAAGR